jgi:hypothetical protein
MKEYLSTAEMAAELTLRPRTLQNMKSKGIFKKGIHYAKPKEMGPRWNRSAMMEYMSAVPDRIPLKRRPKLLAK